MESGFSAGRVDDQIGWGMDGIITDEPDLLFEVLEGFKQPALDQLLLAAEMSVAPAVSGGKPVELLYGQAEVQKAILEDAMGFAFEKAGFRQIPELPAEGDQFVHDSVSTDSI